MQPIKTNHLIRSGQQPRPPLESSKDTDATRLDDRANRIAEDKLGTARARHAPEEVVGKDE
jgi:hypothetical protein